jgi:hypothetical protein
MSVWRVETRVSTPLPLRMNFSESKCLTSLGVEGKKKAGAYRPASLHRHPISSYRLLNRLLAF